jgi:hypothetical protein
MDQTKWAYRAYASYSVAVMVASLVGFGMLSGEDALIVCGFFLGLGYLIGKLVR